ncbi:MAG TPA: ATP-dependent helicase, partial [Flavobacterium sp.]|nr:ATP-dependent helicase [Flavobacterium sp.]
KSRLIVKNIIHNYTAFDISTIDKFTLKIIKSFSHELNIPVDFDISLDTDLLMQEAVESVISKAGEDDELTRLLLDYSKNNTHDDKNWDITNELLVASKQLTNENYKSELIAIENKSIAEFVEIKKIIQIQLKELKQQAAVSSTEILNLLRHNGIDLESFSYKSFPNHLQKIVNGTLESKDFFKFIDIESVKVNKKSKDTNSIAAILPEALQKLEQIYMVLQKHILLEAFNKNIYPLSLLNSINQEFKKIQSDQNIVSISEFNQIIYNEIKNQPAPFIYEKMGNKYRHFFIDEFQDTSVLQW